MRSKEWRGSGAQVAAWLGVLVVHAGLFWLLTCQGRLTTQPGNGERLRLVFVPRSRQTAPAAPSGPVVLPPRSSRPARVAIQPRPIDLAAPARPAMPDLAIEVQRLCAASSAHSRCRYSRSNSIPRLDGAGAAVGADPGAAFLRCRPATQSPRATARRRGPRKIPDEGTAESAKDPAEDRKHGRRPRLQPVALSAHRLQPSRPADRHFRARTRAVERRTTARPGILPTLNKT